MKILEKLKNLFTDQSNFQNAVANIHKWLNGEQQLELHRLIKNTALTDDEIVAVVVVYLKKNANLGQLRHQIGVDYDIKQFAKYFIRMKKN